MVQSDEERFSIEGHLIIESGVSGGESQDSQKPLKCDATEVKPRT